MTWLTTGAALILAAVMATAGLAKLRRVGLTTAEFAELGVPGPAVASRVVPGIEVALAVGLLIWPPWAAAVAFALLAAFSAWLIGVMRSGRVVRCACFGALSSAPVSWPQLVRNAGLMGLALLVTILAPG